MNINEYKSAYDDVHATGSLKKRVMEQAQRLDAKNAKRKKSPVRKIIAFGGGLVGAAAAVVLVVAVSGYLRSVGEPIPSAQKEPPITDVIAYSPAKGCIDELRSYAESGDPRVWDAVPDPSDTDLMQYANPFVQKFTEIPENMQSLAGEEFDGWKEGFLTLTNPLPYCTFDDSMNLLSFVKRFEVPEDKARELLAGQNGLSGEEINAIAARDEQACSRLFTREDVPLIKSDESGIRFYTLENLYKLTPYELSALLTNGTDSDKVFAALENWAGSTGDDVIRAAVLRKKLITQSYLLKEQRPALADDSPLSGYYEQRVSDFNEDIRINGCTVGNYVLKLINRKVTEEYLLESAIYGAASEPGAYTVVSCHRLLTGRFGITADELREALQLINYHYFGQTGEFLYTDEELDIICGSDDDAFAERFRLPTVFCSDMNPIGGTLWLTGKRLYDSGAAGWLEYGDLTGEMLQTVLDELRAEGRSAEAEYFDKQTELWLRIRQLTAAYLDGGTLAADDELLGEAPEFSRDILDAFSGSEAVTLTTPFGSSESVNRTWFLTASLKELAENGYSPAQLEKDIRGVTEKFDLDTNVRRYLLTKLYLYRRNVDYANLYAEEYVRMFLNSDRAFYGDKHGIAITPAPDAGEKEALEKHHVTNIFGSAEEFNGTYKPEVVNVSGEEADDGAVLVFDDGDDGVLVFDDGDSGVLVFDDVTEGDIDSPDGDTAAENTAADISEYMLDTDVNPILPKAGRRGLFYCAGYGYDKWLDRERSGMDFAAAYGDSVAALDSGTVSFAGDYGKSGLRVVIDHADGMQTEYSLCARLLVKEGDSVKKGDIIAEVGDTGNAVGPHLHFAVLINGNAVDPLPYLEN